MIANNLLVKTGNPYLVDLESRAPKTRVVAHQAPPRMVLVASGDDIEVGRPSDELLPDGILTFFGDQSYEARVSADVYTHTHRAYPSSLIKVFSIGLIVAAAGIVVLLISTFFKALAFDVAGAVLTASGTLAVALSVLRGQDLEKRA